jgi:aspartyl-tRNA(Asn)/glutamyl-tRNA(Gln) amidotransferase subunit A
MLIMAVLRNPGFEAPADTNALAGVERAARLLADAGAAVEEADPHLPDTRRIFARVWGAALARLVGLFPEEQRHLIDPGLLEVARSQGGTSAVEFLDSEALRATAAHAMARLHQRYDLVLCPAVPGGPPRADAPTVDPVQALWTQWAPWTFTFNITHQPATTVPMGLRADGLPRAVQIAAARNRDNLVLRAARAIELAERFPMLQLAAC